MYMYPYIELWVYMYLYMYMGMGCNCFHAKYDCKTYILGCNPPNSAANLASIQDSSITASSQFDADYNPWNSRLNNERLTGCWAALTRSNDEWIQADLESVKVITKVATQGRHALEQFVTSYKLLTSVTGSEFSEVRSEDGSERIFIGNTDNSTVVEQCVEFVLAQYVRLQPLTYFDYPSMRWEVYTEVHSEFLLKILSRFFLT